MAYTPIDKSDDYFNTLLYSGNNTANRSITGVGFQPDLVWIKGRSGTYAAGYQHFLFDNVRGVGKQIYSNTTDSEATNLNNLYSFNSDGFSLGQSGVDPVTNGSSTEFVAWNWLASNTTASNTDGSITSTVSANTTSGFSIVSFTGTGSTATVGHGLGVTPKMFIVKNRSIAETWRPYHVALGGGQALALNDTNATDTDASYWSNTNPTSSVFTVGTNSGTNGSGNSMIAYCFADVQGFSKFGSYIGNGSSDGPMIYTGFKPAFIITKSSSSGGTYYNWGMWDTARSPTNVNNKILAANTSDYESDPSNLGANQNIDFLSNGFKHRSGDVVNNSNGVTYIYMAFAENPFVTSTGIPACAR